MNSLISLPWIILALLLVSGCAVKNGKDVELPQPDEQVAAQAKEKEPSSIDICKAEAGSPHYYRKAILVSGTTTENDVASDLPGLAYLTSQRLVEHLENLARFQLQAAHEVGIESGETHTDKYVRQIGEQFAAQFVVKLEIMDMTLQVPEGFLNQLMEDSRRNVLIKLMIYDGENGALFYSKPYQDSVIGEVSGYPGYTSYVTSAWFNTHLGESVDNMLKTMSEQINEALACVPFATKIIAVEDDNLHINAGFLHGLKPGETLRVYHRRQVLTAGGVQKLERIGGWIRVNTVFPDKSIGAYSEEEETGIPVNAGDIVRAW